MIVHDRAVKRASRAENGSLGFYIGAAMRHFQCYKNYMVITKLIHTSNMVEFFPTKCENPKLSESERIATMLQDLITVVSNPSQFVPNITYGDELNNTIQWMQDLMCRNNDGTQWYDSTSTGKQGMVLPEGKKPRARAQTFVHKPIRTIVRKKFNDGIWYEGKVKKYDQINKYYTDGDIEEYDHTEMQRYKKKKQQ